MTQEQLREVASLSSGTIARAIGSNRYADIDEFTEWLFDEGYVVNYGQNVLFALDNAAKVFRKRRSNWRMWRAIGREVGLAGITETELRRIEKEAAEIWKLQQKIKEQSMHYQYELKQEVAQALKIPLKRLLDMPYEQWAEIRSKYWGEMEKMGSLSELTPVRPEVRASFRDFAVSVADNYVSIPDYPDYRVKFDLADGLERAGVSFSRRRLDNIFDRYYMDLFPTRKGKIEFLEAVINEVTDLNVFDTPVILSY